MIDRLFRMLFACLALASALTTQAAQVSDTAPCPPNTAQETHTLQSFLIVHVVCSNVQLEIPVSMLDRSILVYSEFAALSTGSGIILLKYWLEVSP